MSYLADIVTRSLPKAQSKSLNFKKEFDFSTNEIIDLILWAHPKAVQMTSALAKNIPGFTTYDYCRNLYSILKENVKYKVDAPGTQDVKSPAQVWLDKYADCKSFSLFIGSVLQNKGIPFFYRFVSFANDPTPTHVYVIVPLKEFSKYPNKKDSYIAMDVVWKGFNQEKQFNHKKDMRTKGLNYVAGTEKAGRGELNLGNDILDISEGEFDLMLAKQRMELLEDNAISRIGSVSRVSNAYKAKSEVLKDALEATRLFKEGKLDYDSYDIAMQAVATDAVNGIYDSAVINGTEINGLFSKIKTGLKKAAKNLKENVKKVANSKTGKFLKKVTKVVTAPITAGVKLLTLPGRMIMKEIMEKKLPSAAPHFLYLFIPDKEVKKFPKKIQAKREKQEKLRGFITKVSTMKDKQFMSIARNGIIKKYKREPEALIADLANKKAILGIGAIASDGYKDSNELVKKLFEATGKKYDGIIAVDDSPNPNDFVVKMPLKVIKEVAPTAGQQAQAQAKGTATAQAKTTGTVAAQTKFVVQKGTQLPSFKTRVDIKSVRKPDENLKAKQLFVDIERGAPFFLYLFINDEKIFPKLPEAVRNKRKKQVELADYIVSNAKIGRDELMAILRKGITKQLGKDPDILLQEAFKTNNIAGINSIGGIIELVLEIVNKILGLFKKKSKDAPKVSKEDTPDNSDFEGTTLEKGLEIANDIKAASNLLQKETGKSSKSEKKNTATKQTTSTNTTETMNVPDDSQTDFSSGGTNVWSSLGG